VETGSSKFRDGLASAIPETKGCVNEGLILNIRYYLNIQHFPVYYLLSQLLITVILPRLVGSALRL